VLMGSAMMLGIAFAAMKQATDVASVWAVEGVSVTVLGVLVLALVTRRERLMRVPAMLRVPHLASVMMLAEGLLAPAAVYTLALAFSLGTVSLVSGVGAPVAGAGHQRGAEYASVECDARADRPRDVGPESVLDRVDRRWGYRAGHLSQGP
jgi:hypothetical protein